jgi:FkbM family methyltransferase
MRSSIVNLADSLGMRRTLAAGRDRLVVGKVRLVEGKDRFVGRLSGADGLTPVESRNDRDDANLRLLLACILREDSNCIDIGAHTGSVLSEMVRISPHGSHIGFEPLPDYASRLRQDFPNVDIREIALADEKGESSFVRALTHPGYSGLREREYLEDEETETITVTVDRLDDVLPEGFVPHFIKVDVEGGELGVFEGGIDTLRKNKPVLWFEHGIGGADHYGARSEDIYDLLVPDVGLRLYDADGNGPLSRSGFLDLFSAPIWNFLATPS